MLRAISPVSARAVLAVGAYSSYPNYFWNFCQIRTRGAQSEDRLRDIA